MRYASAARATLGYPETARWYEQRADTCHPSNRDYMLSQLNDARAEAGQTLFDILVEIIQDHGPGGSQAEDGVVLELTEL
jgi:hypothetical protein